MNTNNNARNVRISEISKAIRNNQYNEYSGKFTIKPIVRNSNINDQQISTTFNTGKKIFTTRLYPVIVRPLKPIVIESRSSLTTLIILREQGDGGSIVSSYKVYVALSPSDNLSEFPIETQTTQDGIINLHLSSLIPIGGRFQVSSISQYGESPRSDLITIINKTSVSIPNTPYSYDMDIWQ
jgi:hypothetical protein